MSQFTHGHALIIGMGADLPNTIQDADGLAQILTDQERCAYPPGQVTLLTNEKATRAAVLSALDALTRLGDAEATVVVYFSGHGYRVTASLGEFYYLMPFGYDTDRLVDTAIRGDEFTSRLRAIASQKLLVLLDCCHAGGLTKPEPAGLALAKAPIPPEAASLLAEGRGRVLIASSQQDELSFAGKPYSAFTLALIEALCGKGAAAKDGYVRVSDLALHAREVVPLRTAQRQHPILNFEQADNFAISYYAAGEAQAKGLPFTEQPVIEPEPGAWRATIDQSISGGDNIIANVENVNHSQIHINLSGQGGSK
jgi:Caspase domain